MDVAQVRADLIAEQDALDAIVCDLTPQQWASQTASPRWSVADQIGHLTFFDETAALAITDPEAFKASVAAFSDMLSGDEAGMDATLMEYRAMEPEALLAAWRTNRAALADAADDLADGTRVPWYGPSMGAMSFLTARLMEAWAHGQDIVDTVGAEREPSDRLRHIAQLGFITRGWSYINRGLEVPDETVGVRLDAPSGAVWNFGPDDASQTVTGPAEDFCLVVTQRRHVDDTDLVITGDQARDWLERAQAFAGNATDGPVAGSF